jgi:hypothetical protein
MVDGLINRIALAYLQIWGIFDFGTKSKRRKE